MIVNLHLSSYGKLLTFRFFLGIRFPGIALISDSVSGLKRAFLRAVIVLSCLSCSSRKSEDILIQCSCHFQILYENHSNVFDWRLQTCVQTCHSGHPVQEGTRAPTARIPSAGFIASSSSQK